MDKHTKNLIRICASLAGLIVVFIIDKVAGPKQYILGVLYGIVYLSIGWDVLLQAAKNIGRGKLFDENFLMSIATVGAFVIGEYPEAVAVMLFYQVGELFQSYAIGKSRRSIAALMDIRPDKAVVIRDGVEISLPPEEAEVGDTFVVRPGERIPLDGTVVRGKSYLNTAALTGESAPVSIGEGDTVLSGVINLEGVLHIKADKHFYDSTVSRILDLVENAGSKKAKVERFITRFAKYYTPAVVFSALIIGIIPPVFLGNWSDWIFRALTFLVVSCPCALVISVPLSFFGGIGGASKNGVLIKGAQGLELLDKACAVVFDKTGTLTKGVFEVQKVNPVRNKEELLFLAASAEAGSNHPIAKSILKACPLPYDTGYAITENAGLGITAKKDGSVILCGNAKLMEEYGIDYIPENESSGTVVYVAHNGSFSGSIVISDALRDETPSVIKYLKQNRIKTYMLSGDNEAVAAKIAKDAGLDHYKAGLLPDKKVAELESIMASEKAPVAFVGDGINDAPALMRADVGISMGGIGSDSAIEASDIVLMHDRLDGIIKAKKTARKTLAISKTNIAFAIGVKFAVLILSALGLADMWLAVFADVGVSVIAILNAMRAMKI
ncbi:MAG: cadmium-translocating P-type ATPase [Clostridiales bacterium]|jgi:Cd2+/Zn2+-exporting ATPase|nr:cadmium-translocating P-type ATPase [Clostridiales bacterium]HOK81911.1 heavy metal translocating P-type ATPase [Clostridia bacterium]HOL61572.1 heavy metal translocating P-type ATPase [Clostridia bacterium]HPO54201.1 heavy metal translocating P-type ATPase [Clostridia bacterium]